MAFVLISAQTDEPGRTLDEFAGSVEASFKGGCRVLGQTWVIETELTPKDVYSKHLMKFLDPVKDKCIVVPVDGEWIAHNTLTKAKCRNLNQA